MTYSQLTVVILAGLVIVGFVTKPTLIYGIFALSALAASALELFTGASILVCIGCFAGCFLTLALLAFGFLLFLCHRVDQSVPQEHCDPFYRRMMILYSEALASLVLARIHIKGMEKCPKDGRFLVVCNHQHNADPAVLLLAFRKHKLAFISKQENADMFVVGKMMHKTMCQLINRENDREALKTILKCIQLLKEDEVSICAFPEGGIKEMGKLSHFRSGLFKIAMKANVPIVVCTLRNSADILPNAMRLKKTDVYLNLVDVIPAEALKGRTTVDVANQAYDLMLADLGESFRPEEA